MDSKNNKNYLTDKKMFKNIIHIAFLFVAGICITACSSGDDDIANNTTPGTPGSKENVVILTGTIGASGEMTRALGTDGKTVSWKVNDAIAVHYEKDGNWDTVEGKITKVDGNNSKLAEFTAKLTNPKDGGGIGLAYPYSHVDNNTFDDPGAAALDFNYSCLNTQGGTTATITDSKLDLAKTEAEDLAIEITGGAAKLKNNAVAELVNQVCICKFNLKSSNGAVNLYTKSLTIQVGSSVATYSLTPPSSISQSTFYVAMLPTTGNTVTLTASIPDYTSSGSTELNNTTSVNNMGASDIGKIIAIDKDDDNQAYLCPADGSANTVSKEFSNATILNKGRFYEKDVLLGTLTPIAVVAYAGDAIPNYCSKFIALALNDIPTTNVSTMEQAQSTVQTWASNHAVKIAGATYDDMYNHNYDEVKPNVNKTEGVADNATDQEAYNPSNTSTSLHQGWRVPSVTDWRYVIQGLGGSTISTGPSATTPKGIGDHNFVYSGTTSGYAGGINVRDNINTKCGNSELHLQYYWSSSYYQYDSTTKKPWRYNFDTNRFEWNSAEDMSLIRAVLAY